MHPDDCSCLYPRWRRLREASLTLLQQLICTTNDRNKRNQLVEYHSVLAANDPAVTILALDAMIWHEFVTWVSIDVLICRDSKAKESNPKTSKKWWFERTSQHPAPAAPTRRAGLSLKGIRLDEEIDATVGAAPRQRAGAVLVRAPLVAGVDGGAEVLLAVGERHGGGPGRRAAAAGGRAGGGPLEDQVHLGAREDVGRRPARVQRVDPVVPAEVVDGLVGLRLRERPLLVRARHRRRRRRGLRGLGRRGVGLLGRRRRGRGACFLAAGDGACLESG